MGKRTSCRNFYKELRNAMSTEDVAEKSHSICKRILVSDAYTNADVIYGYYPLGNEVNCLPVLERALKDGKHVALPKTGKDCSMEFYEITSLFDDVEKGGFHIMEPKAHCKLSAEQEGLVLVPGVVFDVEGNRYGYGKGFYDRYFVRFQGLLRMALAYEMQISEQPLKCLDTDIKMNLIVTEERIITN